ncbi:hypothetical protein BDFB_014617, partial [Asbolus verrucosus]
MFQLEHKSFILESYFRNGQKLENGQYSIPSCIEEFHQRFPNFPATLTAERYRNDLLQPVIEQLHDDEITRGFFQQDNATSHKTHATIEFLREFYDERIV